MPARTRKSSVTMFGPVEPVKVQFNSKVPTRKAKEIIVEHFRREGGEIKIDSEKRVVARFGSQIKARVLGVIFIGVKSVPREISVDLNQVKKGTLINVSVIDNFGFGSRAGFADALQKLMLNEAAKIKGVFHFAKK